MYNTYIEKPRLRLLQAKKYISIEMELTTIGRSIQPPFYHSEADSSIEEDEELQLQWAAIQRLPTFRRLRTSVFDIDHDAGSSGKEFKGKRMADVTKLGAVDRHLFIEKLIKHIENDNLRLLQKLRDRIDRFLKFLFPAQWLI